MRVRDIAPPVMPADDDELARLGRDAACAVPTARMGGGGTNTAQRDLTRMANDILKGQMPHLRGGYGIADKHADKPSFALRPYKTSARYASGKAGRRSAGRPI